MYPITSFTASILGILYIFLSAKVIKLREKHQVSLGSAACQDLELAIRAHGNFSEYTPLTLILMLCAETYHNMTFLLLLLAIAFILGRLSHAYAFLVEGGAYRFRAAGMILTVFSLGILILLNLALLCL